MCELVSEGSRGHALLQVPRHDSGAVREALRGAYGGLSELGLYLHVPFCETRCQFCEYTVVDPKKGEYDAKGAYFGALQGELRMYSELLGARKRLVGLDIGGCGRERCAVCCVRV